MKNLEKYDSMLHTWFAGIPESELDQLLIRPFEANEDLVTSGQLFENIFFILSGICNVINRLDNGSEIITLRLRPEDSIGVSESVLNSLRYIASVKACTPVVAAEMDNRMFQRWLSSYPCFVNFILKNLATRLHYTPALFANCQTSASKINLAKYFIDRYNVELAATLHPDSSPVKIHETHEIMGTFLGIGTRTVERLIHDLKTEGLISTIRGKVYISPAQYQRLLDLVASNL